MRHFVDNKIVPVISEINPTINGHSNVFHRFLNSPIKHSVDNNNLYTRLISNTTNIPHNLSAEDIVTAIYAAYSENFDVAIDPFELSSLIFGIDETHIKLCFNFPGIPKDSLNEYIERMDKLSKNLHSRLNDKHLN